MRTPVARIRDRRTDTSKTGRRLGMLLEFHQGTRNPATGNRRPREETSPSPCLEKKGALRKAQTCKDLTRRRPALNSPVWTPTWKTDREETGGTRGLTGTPPQETYRKRLELKPTKTSIWEEKKAIQRRIFLCWLENNVPTHKLKKRFLGRELFPRMCSTE